MVSPGRHWRRRRPVLGNGIGGLSGPAIKPIALRIVWQVAQAVKIPIIGVGGIQTIDDVMEFLVAGASAVQIGTANFYDPGLAGRLVGELEAVITRLGVESVKDVVGTLGPPLAASLGHQTAAPTGTPAADPVETHAVD